MHHRTVSDLMTHSVVSVREDTPFKEIAKVLAEHDITAVPVTDDDGHPLGVVSEADLMRNEARQPEMSGRVPEVLERYAARSGEGVPTGGMTAGSLMTSPAVVAHPEWSVVEAARTMDNSGVKRLPVVDSAERLIGLVSRGDLLRVFLRRDRAIREEITRDVLLDTFHLAPNDVTTHVVDGRVALVGTVERRSTIPVLVRLCRGVDGVIDVSESLEHRHDDTAAKSSPEG